MASWRRNLYVLAAAETVAVIRGCASAALEEVAREKVSPETRKHLGKIVHWTYTFHVQGYSLPKSLNLI